MRSKEEIIRAFAETDPTQRQFNELPSEKEVIYEIDRYRRERLMIETLLDIRDILLSK